MGYIITRKCAIELLDYYDSQHILENTLLVTPDEPNGIYYNVNNHTPFIAYTYKFPMFTYRDNNDSQLGNCLHNQTASKRHVTSFLEQNKLIMLNN